MLIIIFYIFTQQRSAGRTEFYFLHFGNTWPLCLTLKDDTTERKPAVNRQTKPQRFIKLKELQADKLANAFAAHLILPNRTQSPPTTLTIKKS